MFATFTYWGAFCPQQFAPVVRAKPAQRRRRTLVAQAPAPRRDDDTRVRRDPRIAMATPFPQWTG
jgi:hypothetical protein